MFDTTDDCSLIDTIATLAREHLDEAGRARVAQMLAAEEVDTELAAIAVLGGIDKKFNLGVMSFDYREQCVIKMGLNPKTVTAVRESRKPKLVS